MSCIAARRSLVLALPRTMRTPTRAFTAGACVRDEQKLKDLYAKFSDPSSPFYLAPGEVGPASPDDHTVARPLAGHDSLPEDWTPPDMSATRDSIPPQPHLDRSLDRTRAAIHEWFDSNGFDSQGRLEYPVAWGESDMFQHINNVSYARYLESQRMRWVQTFENDLGSEITEDLKRGRNTSFIVKDVYIRYRFPVTWPDSLIWGCKPHSIDKDRAEFKLAAAGWSITKNKLAITSECGIVLFDYNKQKRGVMSDEIYEALKKRGGL